MKYTRNVDVLNDFFGLKLGGWQRGEYHSKTNPKRVVWFPKLDYRTKKGKLKSGDPHWHNNFADASADASKEMLITKPVDTESESAVKKWAEICWRDESVEIALFARSKNSDELDAEYYGIYCFIGGEEKNGERRYERIEKEIEKNTAADWLC